MRYYIDLRFGDHSCRVGVEREYKDPEKRYRYIIVSKSAFYRVYTILRSNSNLNGQIVRNGYTGKYSVGWSESYIEEVFAIKNLEERHYIPSLKSFSKWLKINEYGV